MFTKNTIALFFLFLKFGQHVFFLFVVNTSVRLGRKRHIARRLRRELEKGRFELGNYALEAIEVWHHKMQVLGFRIGKLANITDAKTITKEEKLKLLNLDVLIINALHEYTHLSHFNLEEALQLIAEIQPKQSYLTHISHLFGLHEKVNSTLPPNVSLAFDGLELSFDFSD